MKLYQVISHRPQTNSSSRESSDGFESRASAARFAAALAASGQCDSADIESYETDETDD